jgi:hypothetical protein
MMIITWIFVLAMIASLAEMASMAPTAGFVLSSHVTLSTTNTIPAGSITGFQSLHRHPFRSRSAISWVCQKDRATIVDRLLT